MSARSGLRLGLLALVLAAAPACTDSVAPGPASPSPSVGSIQIGLAVPPSFEIDLVSYQISHGAFSRAGTLDVSKSSTITGVIGGLPVGGPYQITLSATDVGHKFSSCAGSGTFDVSPSAVAQVPIVPMEKIVRDRTDHLYPEFNTHIPDAPLPEQPDRFNRFGRFKQIFESQYVDRAAGTCKLPSYVDLYYPNDHGGGANDINPTGPAWDATRYFQDNDAALGLTVELVSKSPCWKDTVIFVVEDDTQNGLDHVNGYRSIFLAISPWVKREYVAKRHLSLESIFKTVDLIFGIPPLNQYDAAASDLREMFTHDPDFTPYDFVQPTYVAQAKASWKRLTRHIDFSRPDQDEVALRRAIRLSEGLPHRHGRHAPRR